MSELFPVQDSTLDTSALMHWAVITFGLSLETRCEFVRKGICDTYKLATPEAAYFLKVYKHRRRTRLDVGEEVRLLNHVMDHGVRVALPVASLDGRYVHAMSAPEGIRYAVLFTEAAGELGDQGIPERIQAFGECTARMHAAADKLPEPYQREALDMACLIQSPLDAIATFMEHRPEDRRVIKQIGEYCSGQVEEALPRTKPEFGICHGDLHGADTTYDEQDRPTLFDFDSSGCGWRALDIGVYPASDEWMDTSEKAALRRQRHLRMFLQGYESVRTLSSEERWVIELCAPIRHIFLMGHVLRNTRTQRGNHWANDDFIDWHMTWFNHWAQIHL